jgi:hypothetical protein
MLMLLLLHTRQFINFAAVATASSERQRVDRRHRRRRRQSSIAVKPVCRALRIEAAWR